MASGWVIRYRYSVTAVLLGRYLNIFRALLSSHALLRSVKYNHSHTQLMKGWV